MVASENIFVLNAAVVICIKLFLKFAFSLALWSTLNYICFWINLPTQTAPDEEQDEVPEFSYEDSEEDLVLSDEAKDEDSSSLNEDTEEDADSFNFNEPDTIQHTAFETVME